MVTRSLMQDHEKGVCDVLAEHIHLESQHASQGATARLEGCGRRRINRADEYEERGCQAQAAIARSRKAATG